MLKNSKYRFLIASTAVVFFVASFAEGQIIQNDVFWKDTDGNPMYVQRGGALKVGDTWYIYGAIYGSATSYYNQWTGGKATTPGGSAACYSSKDLVNWKFEGAVFRYGGWFCGPNVAYNKSTKKYGLASVYESTRSTGIYFRDGEHDIVTGIKGKQVAAWQWSVEARTLLILAARL